MNLKFLIVEAILISYSQCTNLNAFLELRSKTDRPLRFGVVNSECHDCSITYMADILYQNVTVELETFYPSYHLYIQDLQTNEVYCNEFRKNPVTFGEQGTYLMLVTREKIANQSIIVCTWVTMVDPLNLYDPLYISIGVLVAMALVYIVAKYFYKNHYKTSYTQNNNLNNDLGPPQVSTSTYVIEDSKAKKVKPGRMKSVDVLRGFCLCIMIFVNYGAGGYSFLDHAPWNGLHLADTVFPGFIFIMGISLPLSFKSLGNKVEMRDPLDGSFKLYKLFYKIIKRCILLFFFGLVTSNSSTTYLSQLRIMGVLQRFSITFFCCSLIEFIYFRKNDCKFLDLNSIEISWHTSKWLTLKLLFKEIFYYPLQWVVILLIGFIWLTLTFLLPVKGCSTGYIGPGGLHENSSHFNCTGGSAGLIDRTILGESHVYQTPTSNEVYKGTLAYDPEGLLGCLTSIILCYIGMTCGHIIIHYQQPKKRIIRFLAYGVIYGAIAGFLCNYSTNDGPIPVNKNLWSLSFILTMASLSFIALTVFYLLIDIFDIYSGTPFLYLGRNSITIYICHIIFGNYFPFFKVDSSHADQLSYNLYGVAIWCVVAAKMNHDKLFINL